MQRTRFSRKVLVVDDEPDDMIIEKNQLLAELQTANAKLTEANRRKGIFLEVASHELNTPVTVVLGLTDLWKLSLTNDATGPERQWVDRINAAARRLAKTVQRMFFFRKLDVTDKSPE